MSQVNITKDVQALHAYEKAKATLEANSKSYRFSPCGLVHSTEHALPEDHSGDYWEYAFKGQELELLEHYLECGCEVAVNNAIAIIMHGDASPQSFQHALALVLAEFA